MISIVRANIDSEKPLESRIFNELDEDNSSIPLINCIKRVIMIRNIDPEEFENQEVNDMSEEDKVLSTDELDKVESEIPAEVDDITDEDLGIDDDIDSDEEGGETVASDDEDMSDEELDELEKEIPPEVDQLKDEDLEIDPDLEDIEGEESEEEKDDLDAIEKEESEEEKDDLDAIEKEEDLDEGIKLNEYI